MTQANVKTTWFGSMGKFVPAIASTLAALTTVVSFLFSTGAFGKPDTIRHLAGNGAAWINLSPSSDTAHAVGDTLHLAAIITDHNGAVLAGSHPAWSTDNPRVARVREDGSVLAVSEGSAVILCAVDGRTARARIVVKQKITALRVVGDSTVTLPEGDHYRARVQPLDSRGHPVNGRTVSWSVDDTTVATVDSLGMVTGRIPGRVLVRGEVEGLTAMAIVSVVPTPTSIVVVAGDGQHALAKTTLPQPVIVRILSRQGHAVEGTLVRFRSLDGGSAEPATALTDGEGRARTTWSLGDMPGRQTLLASVEHVDSAQAIVAEVEPVAANTRVSIGPESPSGAVSSAISDPVVVRLTDSTGRVLPNVPVSWTPLDGSSIKDETTRTDSAGEVRARWQFGPRSGRQRLRAQIGSGRSVPPVTVTGNALAGAATKVVVLSGDRQIGSAGSALPRPIVLRVSDAGGNPVPDAAVAFSVTRGSVSDSIVRTDSSGEASVHWTLGHIVEAHALRAKVADLPKIDIAARVTPAPAVNIVFDSAPSSAPAGKALARILVATVKDIYGNVVPDAQVRFATKTGSISPATAATDANGRVKVKWTLSSKTGEHTLNASVKGSDAHASVIIDAVTSSAPTPVVKKPALSKAAPSKTSSKSKHH